MDMGSGYWQVVAEEEVHKILVFFTPYGKWGWKVMPMGDLSTAPIFVAMMVKLQIE